MHLACSYADIFYRQISPDIAMVALWSLVCGVAYLANRVGLGRSNAQDPRAHW